MISGANIKLPFCTLRQPTLDDIRRVGYDKYNEWLYLFAYDPSTVTERIKERAGSLDNETAEALLAMMEAVDLSQFSSFEILTSDKAGVRRLLDALSFFVIGEVVYRERDKAFVIVADSGAETRITSEDFDALSDAVRTFSLPGSGDSSKELKFSSESARRVYEQCEAGRKKAKRKRAEVQNAEDYDLGNIISAIATEHNSLNLLNIWGLTPYQLYNQFARVDRKTQIDIVSLKWAAWGSDPFEFDSWRKAISNKGD